MDSNNQNLNDQPDFQKKPLEQPILDQGLREKIIADNKIAAAQGSGLKKFYQANKWYIWAIAAGVVIIAVLAFLAFRKPAVKPLGEAKVNLTISANDDSSNTVASGGEVIYRIKVENQDSQKLVNLELELAYPEGVTYISSSPKSDNLSGTLFKVPDLIPGQNAVVIVKAKAVGNINDEKKLDAKLHYRYSNFNSEFVKDQDFTVKLVASDMVLEISGPATANNAQIVVYEVKYKNNSKDSIKNARVTVNYPQGFNFASSQPAPDMGNNSWNLSLLPSGQEGTISIQGNFSSANPGESKTATVDLGILGQDGQYHTQATSNFTTTFSSLPLLISQELQNANGSDTVNPGDQLSFNLKYQNNASTAATGVNIIVTLDSKALDLSSIQAQGAEINNNTLVWNASGVPNLGSLNPSDSGQLSFFVKVKDPATRDSSKNLTVISNVKIKSNEYDTFLPGNQLNLKISSPVALSSRLDHQSGNLPPQVGKTTTYKVRINLKNETNDYSDGVLTLFLPSSGSFVSGSINAAEASKTTFDPSTGKLAWNFGSLPAHTGGFTPARYLEFSVKISPSSAQVNQSPTLVKNIQFQARDLFTNKTVTQSLDDITTADIYGDQGYYQGVVQP